MLRKKFYGIISVGTVLLLVTTYFSIKPLVSGVAALELVLVLTVNLGVFASLLIGLLEYFVFHRIKTIVKDIDDVENNRKPKYCLVDHGSNDEISYITRKLSQAIDGLYYSRKQKTDLVIQYSPTTSTKSNAI